MNVCLHLTRMLCSGHQLLHASRGLLKLLDVTQLLKLSSYIWLHKHWLLVL